MPIFTKLYFICCVLRIALIFVPQTGYIHPDEYFQSLEVVTGEIFDVHHKMAWEFNYSMPIRSWAPIFIFVKLPLNLLHHLHSFCSIHPNIPSPYSLLVVSRLPTTLFSFVNDLFVYLLAKRVHVTPAFMAPFFYGLSHTTVVHMTHTLSNSWEASALSSIAVLAILSTRRTKCNNINSLIFIVEGIVLAFALFCRPTIVLFTGPYIILQLYFLSYSLFSFISFCVVLPVSFLISSLSLIYFDSLHYQQESIFTLFSASSLSICISSLKEMSSCLLNNKVAITPLNFLFYNLNSDNLSQHGRHPWYTHLLVNMPQLLGPFYFMGLLAPYFMLRRSKQQANSKEFNFQIVQRKAYYIILCGALLPVFCLSLFCHQEARFLLPVVTLWSILSAIAFQHYILSQSTARSASRRSFRLLSVWVAFNLLGIIFWGFLHQGGVVKSLLRFHALPEDSSCSATVFYRTYMPPESLLLRPRRNNRYSGLQFACHEVHDLAGSEEVPAMDYLMHLVAKMKTSPYRHKFLYLTFPYSGVPEFALTNSSLEVLFEREYDSVFETVGHFSGEYPPDLYPHSWPDIMQVWTDWKKQLTLVTYRFKIL